MLSILLIVLFLILSLIWYLAIPLLVEALTKANQSQTQQMLNKYDMYLEDDQLKICRQLTLVGPVIFALLGVLLFHEPYQLIGGVMGILVGYGVPKVYLNTKIAQRKDKFHDQLMDALMIMSSSLRGGLSLVQAIEAVVDEMPQPAKKEFGVVLGENKMGVSLDESLKNLYKRMPSAAMQQMITAIILARETGGNLPVIFSRIIESIRERRRIEMNLNTLTLQGKIQAVVMSGLPIVFVIGISSTNPHFFDVMLKEGDGRNLLYLAGVLWVIGALSIWKISTFKDL